MAHTRLSEAEPLDALVVQPVAAASPGERSIRYPGWRVAAASSAGVLVGFASLFIYTFAIFLKPLAATASAAMPKAAETASRDQPNSAASGFRKMAKV